MADLTAKYMGLALKSPVIVGSCGLTNTLKDIKRIEQSGAGAIVLKSIFEEQIRNEAEQIINYGTEANEPMMDNILEIIKNRQFDYEEAMEYLSKSANEFTLKSYLQFITEVKGSVKIPVIASVNCVFTYDWHSFATKIEEAGADAIELNVYVLPSDPEKDGVLNEDIYFKVVESVKKYVRIPVSIKVGYYFSGLAGMVTKLSKTGISGMVLFNRPYNPDINIETLKIIEGSTCSSPQEFYHTLRWVALLSGKMGCDLSAATGIHHSESVIKQLLAGANTVQVVSALYLKGIDYLSELNEGISNWMDKHGFKAIDDFRGKMAFANLKNPEAFERVQFMKIYSQIK